MQVAESNNNLVLVIPSILEVHNGKIRVDSDFANNLRAYLTQFDRVDVYCPAGQSLGGFPALCDPEDIAGHQRLTLHVLPTPYREDRFLRHYRTVRRQLEQGLRAARYRLISPYAPLNWASLAAHICIAERLPYNLEADWDLARTSRYILSQQPRGLKRFYRRARLELHLRDYNRLLRGSALSLVQGQDVYNTYKHIGPNVHAVLNVQITAAERITPEEVAAKVAAVTRGEPLRIFYAGRASEMKGPMQWLEVMRALKEAGVAFEASWFGDGELADKMRRYCEEHALTDVCKLPGNANKAQVLSAMRRAHLFVFCHMGFESPRNLMEAVASGAPLCGFGTAYSRSLVEPHGGGAFVERGDCAGLAEMIRRLANDRGALAQLIEDCARSGQELDRDKSIQRRIDLMKQYL